MARARVRLTFPSELVQQPIIYRLVSDFGIVPNIRRADVRADHGWMVLELEAPDDKLGQGVAWLRQQGIKVDPIEGDMVLRIYEGGAIRDVPIRAGEILLLPPRVPHSPQRPAHSVGLVIERARRPAERDGLQWYCEHCGALLYEEYLELKDIETQFPPVFARYYARPEHRRCRQCGTVAPGAAAAPGESDDAAR